MVGSGVGWEGAYKATSSIAVVLTTTAQQAQLQPASVAVAGWENNIMLLGRAQNSNHSSGWPTRYVFLVQLDQRDDKKNKKINEVCQPYLEGWLHQYVTVVVNSEFVLDPQNLLK